MSICWGGRRFSDTSRHDLMLTQELTFPLDQSSYLEDGGEESDEAGVDSDWEANFSN